MLLSGLKTAFEDHVRRSGGNYKWSTDYQPLHAAGFQVKKIKACRVCQALPPSKAICGDHFSAGKNRTSRVVVHNLCLKRKGAGC
jgi:hypothetical protein